MKALLIIIFILFVCFVAWMMFALCWIAGEADDLEEEIWSRKGEENSEEPNRGSEEPK